MMKKTVYSFLDRIGCGYAWRGIFERTSLPVLAYHRVAPWDPGSVLAPAMVVQPEDFARQMEYLARNYLALDGEGFAKALAQKKIPPRSALVTFDDAYEDNYRYAFPILKKFSVPAVVFVPTAFIETGKSFFWDEVDALISGCQIPKVRFDFNGQTWTFDLSSPSAKLEVILKICPLVKTFNENDGELFLNRLSSFVGVARISKAGGLLSWEQMRAMRAQGVAFGGHTHRHLNLARLSPAEIQQELRISTRILDEQLAQKTVLFAYPFGAETDIPAAAPAWLSAAGYQAAFSLSSGLMRPGDRPFLLRRIGIGGGDTEDIFRLKLSGILSFLAKLKNS
ncbi:MAG: polysaccharide deacetylase family protein [Candidatus Omnitrophica bacterium]|nr:polysaccharide deacetylase family protein [Candidatus Omnitrophota bacterium]